MKTHTEPVSFNFLVTPIVIIPCFFTQTPLVLRPLLLTVTIVAHQYLISLSSLPLSHELYHLPHFMFHHFFSLYLSPFPSLPSFLKGYKDATKAS